MKLKNLLPLFLILGLLSCDNESQADLTTPDTQLELRSEAGYNGVYKIISPYVKYYELDNGSWSRVLPLPSTGNWLECCGEAGIYSEVGPGNIAISEGFAGYPMGTTWTILDDSDNLEIDGQVYKVLVKLE